MKICNSCCLSATSSLRASRQITPTTNIVFLFLEWCHPRLQAEGMILPIGLRSHHFSFWRVILNNYNIIFLVGFSLKSKIVHFSDWEIDFLKEVHPQPCKWTFVHDDSKQCGQLLTHRMRIDKGLLHILAKVVPDDALEHAHVGEGQVADEEVAVGEQPWWVKRCF